MSKFDLQKGERFNLSKEAPGMTKVRLGLGWEPNGYDTGTEFDADVSLFGLGENSKIVSDDYFIYYKQLRTPDGAIVHNGDNRTGAGNGDDETIDIDLSKLDPRVTEISVIVTIYEADVRRQNFGQLKNSFIKLYDAESGAVKAQYLLEDEFSGETAVQFGSLYKRNGEWLFKAVGAGYKKGLGDFVAVYAD